MVIGSEQDVRDLLTSEVDDAHLILEQGRLTVVSADQAEADDSALIVATAREIWATNRSGELPDDDQIAALAARLDVRASQLGA